VRPRAPIPIRRPRVCRRPCGGGSTVCRRLVEPMRRATRRSPREAWPQAPLARCRCGDSNRRPRLVAEAHGIPDWRRRGRRVRAVARRARADAPARDRRCRSLAWGGASEMASGDVVWMSAPSAGFLRLHGFVPNDPERASISCGSSTRHATIATPSTVGIRRAARARRVDRSDASTLRCREPSLSPSPSNSRAASWYPAVRRSWRSRRQVS